MHIIQDSLLFCFYIDKIVGTVRRKGILVPQCILYPYIVIMGIGGGGYFGVKRIGMTAGNPRKLP